MSGESEGRLGSQIQPATDGKPQTYVYDNPVDVWPPFCGYGLYHLPEDLPRMLEARARVLHKRAARWILANYPTSEVWARDWARKVLQPRRLVIACGGGIQSARNVRLLPGGER